MKLLYVLFNICIIPTIALAQTRTFSDSLPSGNNYNKAAFRLWYPNDAKSIAGVIVLVPGSNDDGRNMVEDTLWQNLARRHGFALLGCYLSDHPHKNMDIEHYVKVKDGSGQALLDMLSIFAKQSGHTELNYAPLVLWGFSAGGEFNYEFVCWKPERVIAFIVNKGGIYYTALASEEAQNVPGIFFIGENDLELRTNVVKGIFTINRRFGALWAFVEESGVGHEIGISQEMAIIFFDDIIDRRLPEKLQPNSNKITLQALLESDGLIGDLKTCKYENYATWLLKDYATSWLVNVKVANVWLSITNGRPLK